MYCTPSATTWEILYKDKLRNKNVEIKVNKYKTLTNFMLIPSEKNQYNKHSNCFFLKLVSETKVGTDNT